MDETYTLPSLSEAMQKAEKNVDGKLIGIEWNGTNPILLLEDGGQISMQKIDEFGIYHFKNN